MDLFLLEVKRAKKIDKELQCLPDLDLKNYFAVIKSDLLSMSNWRSDVFVNDSCKSFPDRKKEHLHNYIKFGGFSNAHIELLVYSNRLSCSLVIIIR